MEGRVSNDIDFLTRNAFRLFPVDELTNNRCLFVPKRSLRSFQIIGLLEEQSPHSKSPKPFCGIPSSTIKCSAFRSAAARNAAPFRFCLNHLLFHLLRPLQPKFCRRPASMGKLCASTPTHIANSCTYIVTVDFLCSQTLAHSRKSSALSRSRMSLAPQLQSTLVEHTLTLNVEGAVMNHDGSSVLGKSTVILVSCRLLRLHLNLVFRSFASTLNHLGLLSFGVFCIGYGVIIPSLSRSRSKPEAATISATPAEESQPTAAPSSCATVSPRKSQFERGHPPLPRAHHRSGRLFPHRSCFPGSFLRPVGTSAVEN